MKNKYVNHAHISERKFREILRLFALDVTVTKIAEATGSNRRTVNVLVQKIRARIEKLALAESPFSAGEIEIDESFFGPRRVKGKRGRGAGKKTKVFGMKKRGDKVFTQIVENCAARTLVPIIKRLAPDDSTIYSDEWKAYDGLVNAGYKRHYRVKHKNEQFVNGRAHINGIESFWGGGENAAGTVSRHPQRPLPPAPEGDGVALQPSRRGHLQNSAQGISQKPALSA